MRNKTKAFDYVNVIKYLIIFTAYLCLNKLEPTVYPYSTALYTALIASQENFVSASIFYLLSFIVLGRAGLLASSAIVIGATLLIRLIRKFNSSKIFEYVFFTAISMSGFLFLGDTSIETVIEKRVICVIISCVLTLILSTSISAIEKKGFKFKMNVEEYLSIIVSIVAIGIGVCNLVSPLLWKSVSLIIILLSSYFFNTGISVIIASSLGVSLSIYFGSINFVAIYVFWGLIVESFKPFSRYLSAISVVFFDYLIFLVFNVYPSYGVKELLPISLASVFFCIIPTKFLSSLKEKFLYFREKQLVRQTINRNRLMLSNKLFELSAVFMEMSSAFDSFKKREESMDKVKERSLNEIREKICKNCENYPRCKTNEKKIKAGINKMIDIGLAKSKLSLIDLPEEVGSLCIHPTDVIFCVNKFLSEFRNYRISYMNLSNSRAIIAKEAEGVSEILKGLALETGTQLKYQSKLEKTLLDELQKKGFLINEILIFGEENQTKINLILNMKEFSLSLLNNIIEKIVKCKVILCEKNNITEEKIFLSFKKRVDFDAVFGTANVKKDGSDISGDTHSVLRISDDKFLVALSDGMGSGEDAQNISSVSLSLIESFYKAGMNSNLILATVNKLLSINTEDSFTALDVSVINLKDGIADFIKYGAPYGFIINEGAVKIIEGNTLPLGILEDLAPSVAQTKISDGDMIVLLTDGISDAFGSSSAVIDFLRTVPAKNPQTLSNQILAKAISLNGGKHLDDMTALAVRIFKTA